MTAFALRATRPGDVLLYGPANLYGYLIAIKTWHRIAHCEGYIGFGHSVASRDGRGVNIYPFRSRDLAVVLRPPPTFDMGAAMQWFRTVRGQPYDWIGLLRFLMWGRSGRGDNGRQFCSEFLTRWQRAGGIDPFNGDDADAVAPFEFAISPVYTKIWSLL